jgi:hypothetical protein
MESFVVLTVQFVLFTVVSYFIYKGLHFAWILSEYKRYRLSITWTFRHKVKFLENGNYCDYLKTYK